MLIENITQAHAALATAIEDLRAVKIYLKRCSLGLEVYEPSSTKITTAMSKVGALATTANTSFNAAKAVFTATEPLPPIEDES